MPFNSNDLNNLPDKPGVYLIKDVQDRVIYVGKALSLKKRIKSYFKDPDPSSKVRSIMKQFNGFEYIITDTEKEALILESNLIKKLRPKYNVRLKDDKRYPYIKITNEDYPRVLITRVVEDDGSYYYGPFTDSKAVRKTLKFIKSLFKIRDCKRMDGPCLNYQMDLCYAPCNGEITKKSYRELVNKANLFLEGKRTDIIEILKDMMIEASSNQEYEKAAVIRDQINSIKSVIEKQKVVFERGLDQDTIACSCDDEVACVVVFSIRGGKIVGKDDFFMDGVEGTPPGKILSTFLKLYYANPRYIPPQIILQHEPDEKDLIVRWLSEKRGSRISLNVPKKGKEYRLIQMVAENAEIIKNQEKHAKGALLDLKKHLRLPKIPSYIEAFDISNIRGRFAVGSMVVFENGIPKKNRYRRYKVKTGGPDDYAMMQEVLERRYKRLLEQKEAPPDLLLVDGGKGQLNVALSILKSLDMDIPVIGIAKEFEHIFVPNIPNPIILPDDSKALHLLQKIRDEAHRFAVDYHRRLRSKRLNHSALDEVKGVGPKRKMNLIRHFGSVDKIKKASVNELMMVEGISKKLAEAIYKHFRR